MPQIDLFGDVVVYQCKKCPKSYPTMSQMIRHSKRAHKKQTEIITYQNFILENFKMISTKTVVTKFV